MIIGYEILTLKKDPHGGGNIREGDNSNGRFLWCSINSKWCGCDWVHFFDGIKAKGGMEKKKKKMGGGRNFPWVAMKGGWEAYGMGMWEKSLYGFGGDGRDSWVKWFAMGC